MSDFLKKRDVLLADPEMEDAHFILELENLEQYWKFSQTREKFDLKDIELFITKNITDGLRSGQKRFLITYTGQRAGCIDLFDFDLFNLRSGVGILIHPAFQKKGIGSHALKLLIEKAKIDLKLHQLYCTIQPENKASISMFENHGFIAQGYRKDWTYFNNQFQDEIFYQLIFTHER